MSDAPQSNRRPGGPPPDAHADPRPDGHPAAAPARPSPRDAGADPTLDLLLRAAERGLQVALTVSVDGTVVTGTLIGTATYHRALADQFMAPEGGTDMDEKFADDFRSVVDQAQREVRHMAEAPADATGLHATCACWLHLTDARVVSGAALLPHGRRGLLWRCRVDAVGGWSLGDVAGG